MDRLKDRSPLLLQVDSLPELATTKVDDLTRRAADALSPTSCKQFKHLYIMGCGDSHHAGVSAELACEILSGLPVRATTAMQFGRYIAPQLPLHKRHVAAIGISVSGEVSRTIEALDMAQQAGATTMAVTGNQKSPLAAVGDSVLTTSVPSLPNESPKLIVPGARSYVTSLVALYVIAIHIGEARDQLNKKQAVNLRSELVHVAEKMETIIASCDPVAERAVRAWEDAETYIFCGSGPNFGTALFSAAKILEASGDAAVSQDIEEWAHLEYFSSEPDTPTFLISAAERDEDRVAEIATAAKAIGRRLAIIAPGSSSLAAKGEKDILFPISDEIREIFSPLITCLPGLLFAAYRAKHVGEPYFRGFGGGRSVEGGGGISRIRTSHRQDRLPTNQL